jgi:single-stranded-DNA-specific exonuclease
VLGIIASRMVEKYYKPAIILTLFNGHAKGSARSVNNFNIYDALKNTSEQFDGLVQFGGHYHAAGLELEVGKIDEFRKIFNRIAYDMISAESSMEETLTPEIKVDTELDIDEIDNRYVKILKHFEPFGPSNMTPIFLTSDLQIVGDPKIYNNTTYVFRVRKHDSSYPYTNDFFDCIYFNPHPEEADKIKIETGNIISAVYSIDENHWNGKTKIQLKIRDIKIKNQE